MPVSPQNELLQVLPRSIHQRIARQFTLVALKQNAVLIAPDEAINQIYFLNSGVVSIVSDLPEGSVEAAVVGNEGIVGLPAFLNTASTPMRAIVQIPGDASRISTKQFLELAGSEGRFHAALLRFAHALIVQMAYAGACNRLHRAHRRCARWLLLAQDRVGKETFPLTQEFLGQMLGLRRPQVSECMQQLKRLRAIRYRHGQVTIENRQVLEEIVCDCYRIIRSAHNGRKK